MLKTTMTSIHPFENVKGPLLIGKPLTTLEADLQPEEEMKSPSPDKRIFIGKYL